jgi:hypothetical protein
VCTAALACDAGSIRIAAMIGIGLIRTATASGSTSPMAAVATTQRRPSTLSRPFRIGWLPTVAMLADLLDLLALWRAEGRWRETDVHRVARQRAQGRRVVPLEEAWPGSTDAHHGVVILHGRGMPDIPSSTILKALRRRAQQLDAQDCRLMVAGIEEHQAELLTRCV